MSTDIKYITRALKLNLKPRLLRGSDILLHNEKPCKEATKRFETTYHCVG